MIDSKEKLSKCLKIEKGLYFPGGGGTGSHLGLERKTSFMGISFI